MAESTPAGLSPQSPLEYYRSLSERPHLKDRFHDIDEENHFKTYLRGLQSIDTRNFVLDFGNDDAWCALNLGNEDIATLLRKPVCYRSNLRGMDN